MSGTSSSTETFDSEESLRDFRQTCAIVGGRGGGVSRHQRRVVIGIDDSENGERAFRWYLDYMHEDSDRVILVHVMEPRLTYGMEMSPSTIRKMIHEMSNCTGPCQELMQQYLLRAKESGIKHCEVKTYVDSKAGPCLVQAAERTGADTIILGSRGNSRIRRTILGSVSEYVLHRSRIPVTIIPPYNITPRRQSQCCGRNVPLKVRKK